MSLDRDYSTELAIGLQAVAEAMPIARQVQAELAVHRPLTKSDQSPVTTADFAVQALVCQVLKTAYPYIPIVAEETATMLRQAEHAASLGLVLDYTRRRRPDWDAAALMHWIDAGRDIPGELFWTLDPVDGTKGFLRGEHYALALALIAGGRVVLGVLGCPNLDQELGGAIFTARRGNGAEIRHLATGVASPVHVARARQPDEWRMVQSYESSHSNGDVQHCIARELGITHPVVPMDGQAKYGLVARGVAELYLRIPRRRDSSYREKIWDHAAGSIVVEEAGGWVGDMWGKALDFSGGSTLASNQGIVAVVPEWRERVLACVASQMAIP
jgi:HAL2 family 3'(2'),5'-bisphosphate nucleotidase